MRKHMDENHQDAVENKLKSTENKPWVLLSEPEAQKEVARLRKRLRKDGTKPKTLPIIVRICAAFVGALVLIGIWSGFNWPLWILISMLIGIVLLIFLLRARYTASWTGLNGKTLWDWLNLLGILAIPLVVAGAT